MINSFIHFTLCSEYQDTALHVSILMSILDNLMTINLLTNNEK